jgi:hypothetical protein
MYVHVCTYTLDKKVPLPNPFTYIHWFLYKLIWTNHRHDWTIFAQTGAIRWKNSAQTLYIYQKIDFGGSVYGLFYGGIVQISTVGMGAQSRLHSWQFSSRKAIVIAIVRDKACDELDWNSHGDMDNDIPLIYRKLLFVISRKRSVFAVLRRYIIRWISFNDRV